MFLGNKLFTKVEHNKQNTYLKNNIKNIMHLSFTDRNGCRCPKRLQELFRFPRRSIYRRIFCRSHSGHTVLEHLSEASHQNLNFRLTRPFIRSVELVDCCHFGISSSEKWYVKFGFNNFLSAFIRTILHVGYSSGRPSFRPRAVDCDRSKLKSARQTTE